MRYKGLMGNRRLRREAALWTTVLGAGGAAGAGVVGLVDSALGPTSALEVFVSLVTLRFGLRWLAITSQA